MQIVVERLTKNVNENHLYEIFGQYGDIDDLDLPVNRQCGLALTVTFRALLIC
jgi:RNA-binding protein with serine-rich domain 1